METTTQERTSRTFEQAMSNGDAAAFSIGVTRQVIGPLTELSIACVKEQARLAAGLQIVALEALHDAQSAILRRPAAWADGLVDPSSLYRRGLLDTLESTRHALTVMGTGARLVTQTADRLQTAAMDAGRRIRETLESSAGARR